MWVFNVCAHRPIIHDFKQSGNLLTDCWCTTSYSRDSFTRSILFRLQNLFFSVFSTLETSNGFISCFPFLYLVLGTTSRYSSFIAEGLDEDWCCSLLHSTQAPLFTLTPISFYSSHIYEFVNHRPRCLKIDFGLF